MLITTEAVPLDIVLVSNKVLCGVDFKWLKSILLIVPPSDNNNSSVSAGVSANAVKPEIISLFNLAAVTEVAANCDVPTDASAGLTVCNALP